ncbi:MAG: aspartate aminotransferase family protein [Acidobacteriota bacterium]
MYKKSYSLYERAQKSLAGGVSSSFRKPASVPVYFADASGCRLCDVDGNEYIDFSLAWGPMILGYRHPKLCEAVRQIADRPHGYPAQHELQYLVAEQVQQLVPCAQRVLFMSSGSEAVQIALRLARAFTGRKVVVKFEGHYHGWFDSNLLSYHPAEEEAGPPDKPNVVLGSRGQVANAVDNVIVAPWNRLDIVEAIFKNHGPDIAAVITEPVLCNSGGILPLPGYLSDLSRLCQKHGSLLIFDEVITGFRIALGGAQGVFDVKPDLVTLGKALGGGLPVSAVAGRQEILDSMFANGVLFGGTYNANPVSLCGASVTLQELSGETGSLLIHANRMGQMLMEGIRNAARKHGLSVTVNGFGAAFSIHFTTKTELYNYRDTLADDRSLLNRFLSRALDHGIYCLPDGRFYVSTVHTEKEITHTLAILEDIFREFSQ